MEEETIDKDKEQKKNFLLPIIAVIVVVVLVGGVLLFKDAIIPNKEGTVGESESSKKNSEETSVKTTPEGEEQGALDNKGRLILPPNKAPRIWRCGNGVCDSEELLSDGRSYCEKDCLPTCGNKICEPPETWANCGDCPQPG